MASEEDEWEEESLLMVELSGIIDTDWLSQGTDTCKIIGLETDNPLMQLDRYVFSGEYKDAIGTCVLFEKHHQQEQQQHHLQPVHEIGSGEGPALRVKYFDHTFKKLCMLRAFLSEKDEEKSPTDGKPVDTGNVTMSEAGPISTDKSNVTAVPSTTEMPSTSSSNKQENMGLKSGSHTEVENQEEMDVETR